jgi:hypothetical protein
MVQNKVSGPSFKFPGLRVLVCTSFLKTRLTILLDAIALTITRKQNKLKAQYALLCNVNHKHVKFLRPEYSSWAHFQVHNTKW